MPRTAASRSASSNPGGSAPPSLWDRLLGLSLDAVRGPRPRVSMYSPPVVKDGGSRAQIVPSDYNQQRLRTLLDWRSRPRGRRTTSRRAASWPVPDNRFGKSRRWRASPMVDWCCSAGPSGATENTSATELDRDLAPGEWVCVSAWVSRGRAGRHRGRRFWRACLPGRSPMGSVTSPWRDAAIGQSVMAISSRPRRGGSICPMPCRPKAGSVG